MGEEFKIDKNSIAPFDNVPNCTIYLANGLVRVNNK